jgi:RHS repeat-associated protein
LKFSGKEREGYSDLDYFGARYYDHKSYRFNSVDPIINRVEALYNPQLWNLYAYCRNNPITYMDPDGREEESIWDTLGKIVNKVAPQNFIPNTQWINDREENKKLVEEPVKKAIKIAIIIGGAVVIIEMVSDDNTNVKGGGKTGRKRNTKRAQKLQEDIEKAKTDLKAAKTKKEKQKIQKKIDHYRRSLKKSEEHARKSQGS